MSLRALFGKRLQQFRAEREITQEQLAEIAQCTPQHISAIERGVYGMHFDRIDKIAEYFNIPVETLFDFSKLPKNP